LILFLPSWLSAAQQGLDVSLTSQSNITIRVMREVLGLINIVIRSALVIIRSGRAVRLSCTAGGCIVLYEDRLLP